MVFPKDAATVDLMDRRPSLDAQGFAGALDGYLHQLNRGFSAAQSALLDTIAPNIDFAPGVRSLRPAFRGEAPLGEIFRIATSALDEIRVARNEATVSVGEASDSAAIERNAVTELGRLTPARPDLARAMDRHFGKLESDLGLDHPWMDPTTRDILLGMTRRLRVSVEQVLDGPGRIHAAATGFLVSVDAGALSVEGVRPGNAVNVLAKIGQTVAGGQGLSTIGRVKNARADLTNSTSTLAH